MSLASTEAIVTHYLLEFRELGVGMKLLHGPGSAELGPTCFRSKLIPPRQEDGLVRRSIPRRNRST